MNLAAALLLCSLGVPAQEETPSLEVRDGKTQGVLYGFSAASGGAASRRLWVLRADGTLLFRNPEGSFEDFLRRDLTSEEKTSAGRYEIDGKSFKFSDARGAAAVGDAIYNDAGRLVRVTAWSTFFYVTRAGIDFPLTGYFSTSSSFTSMDGKMNTFAFTNYSFFAGGFFATESGAGTFCRQVESKTRESSRNTNGGIEFTTETFRQEATKFYGGDAKSRVGRFELKDSGLILRFDDGKVKTHFLAQIGTSKKPPVLLVIDQALYEGTPGQFSGAPAAAAPATAPAAAALCSGEFFEIRTPEGLTVTESLEDGRKNFSFAPSTPDAAARFTVVAMGRRFDANPEPAELRALAGKLLGKELAEAGAASAIRIDGTEGLRVPLQTQFNGSPLRMDVLVALREGRGLLFVVIGNEAGLRKHEPALQSLIRAARFTGPAAKVMKVAAAGLEFELPEKWTTKQFEQEGAKVVALLPPGIEFDPEKNGFLFAFTTDKSEFKSATDAAAVEKLTAQIQALAPGLEKQGDPEHFKVDGRPAILLRYAAKNSEGVLVLLHAGAVVKDGREVAFVALGPEPSVGPHAAALRRAFDSLQFK